MATVPDVSLSASQEIASARREVQHCRSRQGEALEAPLRSGRSDTSVLWPAPSGFFASLSAGNYLGLEGKGELIIFCGPYNYIYIYMQWNISVSVRLCCGGWGIPFLGGYFRPAHVKPLGRQPALWPLLRRWGRELSFLGSPRMPVLIKYNKKRSGRLVKQQLIRQTKHGTESEHNLFPHRCGQRFTDHSLCGASDRTIQIRGGAWFI